MGSPFCPSFKDPNNPSKSIGFGSDSATPKRSEYKIEECNRQFDALKRTADISMDKEVKSNVADPVEIKAAEKRIQGVVKDAEEAQN